MNRFACLMAFAATVALSSAPALGGEDAAAKSSIPVTLHTPRAFPEIKTRSEWEVRAREIRQQVLVSCGLWPLPAKSPLLAKIFGRIERDGYTVEQVYFQTYPGFYLAGNLYRPLGKGKGPFPGVLNPHGHWANGRLADDAKDGSVPARCISLARQGMVALSCDMVGFHDSHFPDSLAPSPRAQRPFYHVHREFGTNHTDELWNISLLGFQTWNSIRALDFLESLPDVDGKRLGCTGASGGGTQTFILGAVDDRLAALAPVCMVSHTMQGGCTCENAPGLRVKYSNMEIAAAAAPRPQVLVAVTGDWTKMTLEVEGPAIQKVYDLFGAGDRLRYVRFDFNHNYNQTSREAVYAWFSRWLLHQPDVQSLKELPYQKEADGDLRVFPDGKLPADALPREKFIESLKQAHRAQWQALVSDSLVSFPRFKEVVLPAWKHTLQMEWPPAIEGIPEFRMRKKAERVVILAAAEGKDPLRRELVWKLNGIPCDVAPFVVPANPNPVNQFTNFFTTYNSTELQQAVQFLVRKCAAMKRDAKRLPVILYGLGRAGLWAILAAPSADAVIADCDQRDATSDEAMLAPELFCPGIRNIGTFEGAAMLAAPHPLLLHNTGEKFPTESIRAIYRDLGAGDRLRIESRKLSDDEIADWIANLTF